MRQHFVTFFSPGTFVAETTIKRVKSWSVDAALELMPQIIERYHAKPYGFQFHTMRRRFWEFEPREVARSGTYYVGCKVQTLADVIAEGPENATLAQNMKSNGWDEIVTTTEGWKWSQPLRENDIVL